MSYKRAKLFLLLFFIAAAYLLSACSNSNSVSPAGSTTKIVVVNTSPDVGPLALFLNNLQLGGTTASTIAGRTWFRYSTTPTYYTISTDSILFQLQTYPYKVISKLDAYHKTKGNTSYTLFVMGIASIDSLSTVFTEDTTKVPSTSPGIAKIRFINASPRTPAVDVTINGSTGFVKIPYKGVSGYVSLPAGMYEFKMSATGSTNATLNTLSRVTVLDGKLYTLYSKGLVGRTDSAAISLNIITQK
jgi:hypothetical protein